MAKGFDKKRNAQKQLDEMISTMAEPSLLVAMTALGHGPGASVWIDINSEKGNPPKGAIIGVTFDDPHMTDDVKAAFDQLRALIMAKSEENE